MNGFFTISDGITTITSISTPDLNADALLQTDALGNINGWGIGAGEPCCYNPQLGLYGYVSLDSYRTLLNGSVDQTGYQTAGVEGFIAEGFLNEDPGVWTETVTPEPATLGLIIPGAALLAVVLRRSRKRQSAV